MSIITTFESQCRALTSTSSPDDDASRFIVGTLSPNEKNLLYLFEFKDENNNLAKLSFDFPFGEIWHLSTSLRRADLVAGVVGNRNQLNVGLFKLPNELINSTIEDDYGLSDIPIEQIASFDTNDNKNLIRQSRWHPDDGSQLLTCNNGTMNFWDIELQKKIREFSLFSAIEGKEDDVNGQTGQKEGIWKSSDVTDFRWSSLFDCSVVAAAIGSNVYGIDTRISDSSTTSVCWAIKDERCVRIRSIDFNPNSQYYIVSGGDDCRANFWDLRQTSKPALRLQAHTHWIWSIRYNPFHDQLVLSSGSDARVALMRAQSVASDPYGQIIDDEDCEGDSEDHPGLFDADKQQVGKAPDGNESSMNHSVNDGNTPSNDATNMDLKGKKQLKDEIISVYQEHDDSVYAAEWATDPWIFASLGVESRLVINRVPKEEKTMILF